MNSINDMLLSLPGILMAISFHECAHAYVAHLMGDDTAKDAGRISINPVHHIDPFGFLMLLFFRFGWANPVPVIESNFRNRKLGSFLVSIAGVAMNVLLAMVLGLMFKVLSPVIQQESFDTIMTLAVYINIYFAAFNLIPIPPLDGYRILSLVLPYSVKYKLYEYERYSFIILIVLLYSRVIYIVLTPMVFVISKIVFSVTGSLI
jgi:membrane protein